MQNYGYGLALAFANECRKWDDWVCWPSGSSAQPIAMVKSSQPWDGFQATAAWVLANVTIVRGYRIDWRRWLAVIGHVGTGGIVVRPIFAQQPVKLPEVQHQDG